MKTVIFCFAAVTFLVGATSARAQGSRAEDAGENHKVIERLAAQAPDVEPQNRQIIGLAPNKHEFYETVVPGIIAPITFVTDLFELGGVKGWTKFWYGNWENCTIGGRIGFLIGCVICMALIGKAMAFWKELRGTK